MTGKLWFSLLKNRDFVLNANALIYSPTSGASTRRPRCPFPYGPGQRVWAGESGPEGLSQGPGPGGIFKIPQLPGSAYIRRPWIAAKGPELTLLTLIPMHLNAFLSSTGTSQDWTSDALVNLV